MNVFKHIAKIILILFFIQVIIIPQDKNNISSDNQDNINNHFKSGREFFRKQMADSALLNTLKGYNEAMLINNSTLLKTGSVLLAKIYNLKGDKRKSLEFCQTALDYNREDPKVLSDIYCLMGVICSDIGDIVKSTDYYNMALKIREESGDLVAAGYIYTNLGGIYGKFNNISKSIEYNMMALNIFEKYKVIHGIAYVNNNLGQTYYSVESYDIALKYFLKALQYYLQLNDRQNLAFVYNNIGAIYLNNKMQDSAKVYINKSLEYGYKINDKLPLAVSLSSMGKYYRSIGDFRNSIINYEKALKYASEISFLELIETIDKCLSEIYDETGDHSKAYYYLTLSYKAHDSLFNRNAQEYVVNAELKYETEKKDNELKNIIKRHDELESKFNISKLITIIIIAAGFITLLVIVYYYRKKVVLLITKLKLIPLKANDDKRKLKSYINAIENPSAKLPERQVLSDIQTEDLKDKIDNLFIKEKIFLNPLLKESDVAKMLNINTAYLSRFINEQYNCNFSIFINKFRINEAKEMIKRNNQNLLTYEGIASNSGFKSKSAFNSAFKKFTGKTPSEYASDVSKIVSGLS